MITLNLKETFEEFKDPGSDQIVKFLFAIKRSIHTLVMKLAIQNIPFGIFFPKFFWEQFGRFMNFYFFLIASLQLIRQLTPINPVTTWTPLLLIFTISGVKEAIDDYHRLKSDLAFNDRVYNRLSTDGSLRKIKSKDIQVGDFVCLDEGDEIPCDLVLINTMHDSGEALINTSNLDGESNLKTLVAPLATKLMSLNELGHLHGKIECPAPNAHLYSFDARLKLENEWIGLSSQQLLLQGAVLKHPSQVVGIAVYTGAQTKLGNNKQPSIMKLTVLDRQIERVSLLVFSFQLVLVLLLGSVGNWVQHTSMTKHTYLRLNNELGMGQMMLGTLVIPLRMLLLFSLMIPISLKVSLDMIKFLCSRFVGWDLHLMDEKHGPADVANTGVADDLGQIEVVFTDKTGTLTENLMVYSGCSIQGQLYTPDSPTPVSTEATQFYKVLSLCHSVQPIENSLSFQGSSPDEEALVGAAAKAGFRFLGEKDGMLSVETETGTRSFRLLHKLDFSSARKRMSVVVQEGNGPILLLTKGADDTLIPVCYDSPVVSATRDYLTSYAREGLRTLAIASRIIPEELYLEWRSRHLAAETSLQREHALEESAIALEVDLDLLGCTAIEDRLQPFVPQTIKAIRRAGVKIWMLTGDKLDTALQIGRSCCLLPSHGRCLVLSSESLSPRRLVSCLAAELEQDIPDTSLVVDGTCVGWILDNRVLQAMFVQLSLKAPAVICCRTTPKQKGDLVEAIKNSGKITLSIGDGGNDVIMIQQANIGVGIRGREGLQAARAADLSLSRFHHLGRLMLVHGRYSLHRVHFVAVYCFYKSIAICMVQAGYQFLAGFSGSSLLTGYALTLYNVAYTGLPILMYSLDKDVSERVLLDSPELYQHTPGRDPHYALLPGTFKWFSWAIIQGLSILGLSILLSMEGSLNSSALGPPGAGLGLSYMTYSAVVVTVQLTLALVTNHFTWLNHLFIWGGIVVYFSTTQAAAYLFPGLKMGDIVPLMMLKSFWLSLISIVAILTLPTYISVYLQYQTPAKNVARMARLSTIMQSHHRSQLIILHPSTGESNPPVSDDDALPLLSEY
ncbi:hypothetical protein DSO57_1036751 [Entomophthora muscae]|uniref:Uncharacterized protein n=1 Tax=Entomophthora muscae TaxID=34485 RepID=A0ACC2RE02_9FUNG|nr:hypothetical protein DSO57_1036751 [Entomophthora muscae]